MYRFDEYDEDCRSPLGALPQGGALSLTLRYKRGQCLKVFLCRKIDGSEVSREEMPFSGTSGCDDIFALSFAPPVPGLYWYWFEIETENGAFTIDREGPRDESTSPYQLTVYDDNLRTPDWIKGGVMYHIFVDRFARGEKSATAHRADAVMRGDWGGIPGFLPDEDGIVRNNDFFGGNLEGIIEKIPYLNKLGVTCLYLSPIFEANSNHKYDTGDFMKVDGGFGDEATLRALCEKARSCGMRVILDGVFSHVGSDSVYFNKFGSYGGIGAYQSEKSPYHDWFTFKDFPDDYDSWWGINLLPVINKSREDYVEFISGENGVISHWMNTGISGWRLDVVDELPDSFLYPMCASARKASSDALIIGEVWEDASNKIAYGSRRRYFLGGQLDSVMNYPLKDAIIKFVRDGDVELLASTMASLAQNYPKPILDSLMNILGTHDTMRILTALGGENFPEGKTAMSRFKLSPEELAKGKRMLMIASVLQFTLPGFPCVYYGDEAGMEGGADPFNRRCYPWGEEDSGLVEWYRLLASIRAELPAFKDGEYRLVAAREGLFAFIRGKGDDEVLIAANVSDTDKTLFHADFNRDMLSGSVTGAPVVRSKSAAIYTKRRQL